MSIFFLHPSEENTLYQTDSCGLHSAERPPHLSTWLKKNRNSHGNQKNACISDYYTNYHKPRTEKGKLPLDHSPRALCSNNLSLPTDAHEDQGIALLLPRMMQDPHTFPIHKDYFSNAIILNK